MKKEIQVCIIGLGYVGLTLAISLARKGVMVFGVEQNKSIIKQLKKIKFIFMNKY